jgi:rod shape-determining protein MreC
LNVVQDINGYFSRKQNNLAQYLSLKDINNQLANENANLKNEIERLIHEVPTTSVQVKDSVNKQSYSYITAKVLNNSVNKQYNYITIDKGLLDSIKPDMAVISPNGVVGIVESVSDHYALIISLLNRNLKVSAKIKKNNYFGSFEWSGEYYRLGYLNDIPQHVNLAVGDTVVTSGFSDIFPSGVLLGCIADYKLKGGTFFNIDLTLTTDFKNLSFVYVVTNFKKDEQLKLESNAKQ